MIAMTGWPEEGRRSRPRPRRRLSFALSIEEEEERQPDGLALVRSPTPVRADSFSLTDFVKTRCGALDPLKDVLFPLLEALEFLDSRGVLHGHLNPDNLRVNDVEDGGRGVTLVGFENNNNSSSSSSSSSSTAAVSASASTSLENPGTVDVADEAQRTVRRTTLRGRLTNIAAYREPVANALLVAAAAEASSFEMLRVDASSDAYALALCCVDLLVGGGAIAIADRKTHRCLRDLATARSFGLREKSRVLFAICGRNPAFDPRAFRRLDSRFPPLRRGDGEGDAGATTLALRAVECAASLTYTHYPGLLLDVEHLYGRRRADALRGCLQMERSRRLWRHHHHRRVFVDAASSTTTTTTTDDDDDDEEEEEKEEARWREDKATERRSRRSLPSRIVAAVEKEEGRHRIDVRLGRCWIATAVVAEGSLLCWKSVDYLFKTEAERAGEALWRVIETVARLDARLGCTPPEHWPVKVPSQARLWRTVVALHRSVVRYDREDDEDEEDRLADGRSMT